MVTTMVIGKPVRERKKIRDFRWQVVRRFEMFAMSSGHLRVGAGDARQGLGLPRGLFYVRLVRHPAEQGRSFRAEGWPGLL